MSYFAFGLVEIKTEAAGDESHASARLAMQRCAAAAGLVVALGGEHEPSVLSEMRGPFSPLAAIPFWCLAQREDDTSDRLISPHLLGVDGACEGVLVVAEWVGCVIRLTGVERVMIWFTEGFDDAFERHDCGVEDAMRLLVARIREENDIPSMLLSIGPISGKLGA